MLGPARADGVQGRVEYDCMPISCGRQLTFRVVCVLAFLATAFAADNNGPRPALVYSSPSCGPGGGSTPWACGAWATATPPALGDAGTTTADPDTGNRVLRATRPGSFGEEPRTAFKVFDGGWRPAWNADSTRFIVVPWSNRQVRSHAYWVGFDGGGMKLTGRTGRVPDDFSDFQWDQFDPDLIVGLADGAATTYNVTKKKYAKIFDPSGTRWRAGAWMSAWGGERVCITEGPQDKGYRVVCSERESAKTHVIDLHDQTIGGRPFTVYFQGKPVELPGSVGVHTITLAPDGNWLAVDTHGNTPCSVKGLPNYAGTAIFINLETNTGYEWNTACGGTHWAYGYGGGMMQSASPKWTPAGNEGPCNSDSRGIARRNTDSTVDSSYALTGPCSFFNPATWAVNVHLSWTNNRDDDRVNQYPVLLSTISGAGSGLFLANDIAAMETSAPAYQGRLWRFAQTWNDPVKSQCGFLEYSSPSISPDGRWAIFPSDWRGQTGSGGVCAQGNRTDVFVFELK
jgi:hypothetical protein